MSRVRQLLDQGQSPWLDYIRRGFVESGELKRLIDEDGLRGLTSNPKIFMKAITGSDEYDDDLQDAFSRLADVDAKTIYEELAIADIRAAADVLRPVFDETDGGDGFVSFEVSPHLAHETEASIEEARRLHATIDRQNVMIKIPATPEGIPAIETLLAEGIPINITLMFSLQHYEAVAGAYLRALERAADPRQVHSVASVFISRITRKVDGLLDEIDSEEARSLKGHIAIANARVIYRRFRELFEDERFQELERRGARVQRVLWGSTGTKNPEYSDVIYVEELIGKDTVNTMPPDTLKAFRDHGQVRGATIEENVGRARTQLEELAKLGVDLDQVTEDLQAEGVKKFIEPFDELMDAIRKKRQELQPSGRGS